MKINDNIFLYIITYPFIWISDQIEYIFYVYIYPLWTGRPVALGWNPKFVKEELHGLWKPSTPIDIPYKEYIKMANQDLMEYGLEKTKSGHLRRIAHPQMYYANPDEVAKWGDMAWKCYLRDLAITEKEFIAARTLDPRNVILYYDKLIFKNNEIASYNIQMDITLFGIYKIDIIEILVSIIFFLLLTLLYVVFYQLYKLHIQLEEIQTIITDNGLDIVKKEDLSAQMMHNAWREGKYISNRFDLGIELDYCTYEGTLIGFELAILMCFFYFIKKLFDIVHYYIYLFYIMNTELCTYCFFYLFLIISLYYWFRWKREEKRAIHRWVEIDYYFSHFLNHYFRTLAWLNLYKLVEDAPIFYYVLIYTVAMVWTYFACDSCDYFMGWDQEYRIDIYNKETNMHFWWPRVLMNQTWYHFYVTLIKPWHTRIIYLFLFFLLPVVSIYLFCMYYQNKLHVYINNHYFFWNSKRYTIDEIKKQWQEDRKHNYIEEEREKNNKGGGLIIL